MIIVKKSYSKKQYVAEIIVKWSSNLTSPFILLFGWAGCQDRYLAKYSQIYEAQNYSVLRFTVPISKINCYGSYREFAEMVYDKVINLNNGQIIFPIFFHVFSMNGCSLFSSFWDLLSLLPKGDELKRSVKGVIFDSCPADVKPWQGASAVSFASMPSKKFSDWQRNNYRYILTGAFCIHRAFVWLLSNVDKNVYEKHFSYFHLLKFNDIPNCQLYLYSKADVICDASSIEFFQNVQKKRNNIELKSKCWDDSLHVEHIRKYPEEYTSECLSFIEYSNKICLEFNHELNITKV